MYSLIGKIFIFLSSMILYSQEPSHPKIPALMAVSKSEEVKLMWDGTTESSIDSLTGYSDFEGYRIYRSIDGGVTCGKSWNRIFDYSGKHVGWRPLVQFDLTPELDSLQCIYKNGYFDNPRDMCESRGSNIGGYDPLASWINIGDGSGLSRVFIDTDVFDGVEYTYAITAYDMGMKSFDADFINTTTTDTDLEDCDRKVSPSDPSQFYNESQCRTLPHCYWNVNVCEYSDDDYCDGNDSYCYGMGCSGGGCVVFGSTIPLETENECSGIGGVWVGYSDAESCTTAGFPAGSSSFNYEWLSVN